MNNSEYYTEETTDDYKYVLVLSLSQSRSTHPHYIIPGSLVEPEHLLL